MDIIDVPDLFGEVFISFFGVREPDQAHDLFTNRALFGQHPDGEGLQAIFLDQCLLRIISAIKLLTSAVV